MMNRATLWAFPLELLPACAAPIDEQSYILDVARNRGVGSVRETGTGHPTIQLVPASFCIRRSKETGSAKSLKVASVTRASGHLTADPRDQGEPA